MTEHTFIAATWRKVHDGPDWYVDERLEGVTGCTRYGPMPEDKVEPLIAERREVVQTAFSGIAYALKNSF